MIRGALLASHVKFKSERGLSHSKRFAMLKVHEFRHLFREAFGVRKSSFAFGPNVKHPITLLQFSRKGSSFFSKFYYGFFSNSLFKSLAFCLSASNSLIRFSLSIELWIWELVRSLFDSFNPLNFLLYISESL